MEKRHSPTPTPTLGPCWVVAFQTPYFKGRLNYRITHTKKRLLGGKETPKCSLMNLSEQLDDSVWKRLRGTETLHVSA